jgi:hypothetical protein
MSLYAKVYCAELRYSTAIAAGTRREKSESVRHGGRVARRIGVAASARSSLGWIDLGDRSMKLKISPWRAGVCLAAALAAIALLHGASVFVDRVLGHPRAFGLNHLFYLSAEDNVPTLYSSALMWTIAAIALAIAGACREQKIGGTLAWMGIVVLFVFLGIDESASLHERMSDPLREAIGGGGILYFAYILPYGIAILLLTAVYAPFVLKLPSRTRVLFFTSAILYVIGALGMEAIGGSHYETMEVRDAAYIWMITIEELLEIAGLSLFICAELTYIVERFGSAVVTIESSTADAVAQSDERYVLERTASR